MNLLEIIIGGSGYAARILFNELMPRIDPLNPENKLLMMAGPSMGIMRSLRLGLKQ